MHKQFFLLQLAIASSALIGCAKGVPMMGLDDHNKYFEYVVSEKEYQKQLTDLISLGHASVAPTTNTLESQSYWQLRTLVLGLGLKMEGGLGPVITGAASPRIRLAFSNSEKPVVP